MLGRAWHERDYEEREKDYDDKATLWHSPSACRHMRSEQAEYCEMLLETLEGAELQ